ncbi:MAG: M1 family metallopeptidase [Microscillaceae bacterium]|nr:M1 family metallopeptidase [Microscillaceae bacterium]
MKKNAMFIWYGVWLLVLTTCQSEQKSEKKTMNNENLGAYAKDVHSFARPQEVVMNHLDLDLQVDFDKKILVGKATIHFENKAQGDTIVLDTQGLTIEKVLLDNGKETPFWLGEKVKYLGSALKIKISPESKAVTIHYRTSPQAEALQWLTPQQTAGKQKPFLFTQSQAILARSWVPCQDSPGIRFTYTAKVQVPKDLMAVMSAENPQQRNEKGIYEYKMPQPIPAYLLALAVGDIQFEKIGERSGVYAEPVTLKKAVYEFADLEKMLEAAEKISGIKYPWGRYDVIVLPPSFPFGGMENPRITFATPTILVGDRSLTSLIAHELAHSWSGNLVTNATWNDIWLNEGFTVYFERRIMEALYGKSYFDMLSVLGYEDLQKTLQELGENNEDTKLKLNLKDRNPDEGVTEIAYEKGNFFLLTLENQVGREKFDAFLSNYFKEFSFKTMDTERFVKYLKEKLPEAEKIGIEQWIYEKGLPKNCQKPVSERFVKVAQTIQKYIENQEIDKQATQNWSSHEWLFFLRNLPKNLTKEDLTKLDQQLNFTNSSNSEILTAWFELAIEKEYEKAYPQLANFLQNVGRRKFLMPLYKALLKTEKGKQMAKEIYQKARPNYHFVAVNSLDAIIQ